MRLAVLRADVTSYIANSSSRNRPWPCHRRRQVQGQWRWANCQPHHHQQSSFSIVLFGHYRYFSLLKLYPIGDAGVYRTMMKDRDFFMNFLDGGILFLGGSSSYKTSPKWSGINEYKVGELTACRLILISRKLFIWNFSLMSDLVILDSGL